MIHISDLSFQYEKEPVVRNLDLVVKKSEVLCIVGPSGCGKSTLLRLIAGLEVPDRGQVEIRGCGDHELRFLFQDYDAFPWYSVRENLAHASRGGADIDREVVSSTLAAVDLLDAEDKYPAQLSGGMRKRLALARSLAVEPSVLLLDEPFGSLDVDTRFEMYGLMERLWGNWQPTVVLVTHSLTTAVMLGSRVLVSTRQPFGIEEIVQIDESFPRDDEFHGSQRFFEVMAKIQSAMSR